MSRQFARDFALEVPRGNIANVAGLNKFGRNIEIDSGVDADIWDGGFTVASGGVSLVWVAPTAARTHTIASDSASDTDAGVGARTVKIYGLTAWNAAEVNETVTMNTGAPPVTANSYVIIHRMKVLTKGATAVNVGTITATAAVDGTITAQINPLEGQTQMAIYGVPSIQTLYLTQVYASANKAGSAAGLADYSLDYNPEPDVELLHYLTKHTSGLMTVGTSIDPHMFNPYKPFPGPGILKVHALSGTNNMDISAGFDGYLVDN